MGNPVVHFEVVGPDGAKLREYYSQLFGWEIDANNEMNYGMVAKEGNQAANGDLGIGGGVGQGPEGYSGHATFYVAVPDVEETLQKAESLGGQRTMGPETIMDGALTFGQLKDPDGNLIGVVQDQA